MPARKRLPPWLAAAGVFLVTLAVFWPSVHCGFVNWDDDLNLTDNLAYRGLGLRQLRWMLTTAHDGNYMPLTWMSFGLDYLLWGMAPFGYHLSNLLLHSANAALFFFVCLRLLRWGSERLDDDAPVWAAGLAALLFSVHPMRVESVTWATERKDTLSGLFYLSTLLFYLRSCAKEEARPALWRRLSLGSYLLSLLSKGTGVTLPVALIVLDLYPLGRLPADPRRWPGRECRGAWLEKLPFLAMAALFAVIGVLGQRQAAWVPSLEEYGLPQRLAEAAYGLTFYLRTTLFPARLLPQYELPYPFDPLSRPFVLSGLSTAAILAVVVAGRRRYPWLAAAFAVYAATIFPMLGLFQFGLQLVADHYSYLPMLSWALLVGAAALALARRAPPRSRWAVAGVGASILLGLSAATRAQIPVWNDSQTLWTRALSLQPDHSTAHLKLGRICEQRGDIACAAGHYLRAARARPAAPQPHIHLAGLLELQGRFVDAERHFRMALSLGSAAPQARYALAAFLMRRGHVDEARSHLEAAMPAATSEPFALYIPDAAALGTSPRARLPLPPKAAPAGTDPRLAAAAHYAQGVRYANAARWAEAVQEYEAALRLTPAHADARNNLGTALANLGRMPEAVSQFEAAARLAPNDVTTLFNLGNAYLMEKRFAEAAARYEAVLRLAPDHPKARAHLEVARFYLRQAAAH